MNKEELRLEIHAQVNSAAQKQVNAAYTGQTSPIDTAVNVDAIMALFDDALISELQNLWALSDPVEGIRKRLFEKLPTNGDLNT
jgi:hypothetical protein